MVKWFTSKGKNTPPPTIRHGGFNSQQELLEYTRKHNVNIQHIGYNEKDKYYFDYKIGA